MSDKNNDTKKSSVSVSGLAIGLCLGAGVGMSLWNLTGNFVWLVEFQLARVSALSSGPRMITKITTKIAMKTIAKTMITTQTVMIRKNN